MIPYKIETPLGTLNLGFGLQNLDPIGSEGNGEVVFATKANNQPFCRLKIRESEGASFGRAFEVQVDGLAGPGTDPVFFEASYDPQGLEYWMPWDGPSNPALRDQPFESRAADYVPDSNLLDTATWKSPFSPVPPTERNLVYGGHPSLGAGFVLPMVTFFREGHNRAVTLLFTDDSPLIEFRAQVKNDGSITFSDAYHRIEAGKSFRYRLMVIDHEPSWRAAMGEALRYYENMLSPSKTGKGAVEGFGGYSRQRDERDGGNLKQLAPKLLNWASSFDFPYMGLFQPDVENEEEEWTAISCLGDGRIKAGQEEKNSIRRLRESARRFTELGGHELAYFNITEFGFGIRFPAPAVGELFAYKPAQAANAVLWKDFPDAPLFGSHEPVSGPLFRTPAQHHEMKVRFHKRPYWTWGDSVAMDPGDREYQQHLVEQARRIFARVPESSGICIDRCDWTQEYNHHADDGTTWIEDKPVRSLIGSWKAAMRQLRETADEYGKVIYASASIHRADVAECLDGFFHEGGFYGPNLNMNAFLAVFRPLSVWSHPTEIFDRNGDKWLRIELFSGKKIEEPAHTFFQRHLLMGAWPMAPLWNNDHSIQPSPGLVELYREHLPLFRCIEGRKWILSHNAVTCSHPDVETNIFRVKQGYAVPLASTDGSECILNFQLAGDQPRFAKLIVAGGGYIPLDLETHATGLTVKVAPPTNTASIVLLFQTETSLRNRLLQTFQNHPAPTLKWIP